MVLGIESSCDETAAAVVVGGRRVLSNRIASQVPMHQRWGGVVPEIASRAHLEQIVAIVDGALHDAGATLDDIEAIAVTRGPGLVGSLLVGMEFAKGISVARGIPLVSVQHVAGHLYSPFIGRELDAWGDGIDEDPRHEPYIGMAVSGGHSSIALVEAPLSITVLGETLDDAVGEAYDKIAKLIGLEYPGGPVVDKLAAKGDPARFDLPRPMLHRAGFDFSFSGLKTAFAREVEKLGGRDAIDGDEQLIADLCAGFQAACIDVLVGKARRALKEHGLKRLAVVGGVACNRGLRKALEKRLRGVSIALPAPEFCTDNAAMIAGLGWHLHHCGWKSALVANATAELPIQPGRDAWQVGREGMGRGLRQGT